MRLILIVVPLAFAYLSWSSGNFLAVAYWWIAFLWYQYIFDEYLHDMRYEYDELYDESREAYQSRVRMLDAFHRAKRRSKYRSRVECLEEKLGTEAWGRDAGDLVRGWIRIILVAAGGLFLLFGT